MKNLGCKQPFLCCILWNRSITKQIWVYVIPSSAEQMLLLTQNQLFQCLSFKTETATWEAFTRVDGYTGCCHWTGDLFVFIWFPKALGQPDSLECSLAGQACFVTFNHLPRDGCLALSSAFYKVPQSQAVHKQVGIIIKYDY